ncbi:MFS transporter [Thiomicrorhabdus indica]|uniref:MFS transporter n=1 Tax=Thiomicrorhabdus indica TaxID=2267253 RepID=UPI00102DDE15|nr:MFS transporter [Thiomicrorhabdus indica]
MFKLSAFYFFYFTLLGAFLPYLGVYLSSLSFSPAEIGQLMAVLMITKVIAPNIWGIFSDSTGRPVFWVRLALLFATLGATGLVISQSYWGIFVTLLLLSFFWHASLPQFESYTFKTLGSQKHRYGQIRLWGSIGFIAAVLLLGQWFDNAGLENFPWVIVGMFVVVLLSSFLSRDQQFETHTSGFEENFLSIVKRPEVLALLSVSFLVQVSHGVYYSFFTIQMTELGVSKTVTAWLWALGVIAEIAVFWWMAKLFQRFSVRGLILLAIALTVLRWGITGWLETSFAWIVFAQVLHAASFGLFHACAIYLIDQYFTGRHHGKGQALFAASSHGLGGALGMLIAGYAWQAGGASLSYSLMAFSAMLAGFIAWRWVK